MKSSKTYKMILLCFISFLLVVPFVSALNSISFTKTVRLADNFRTYLEYNPIFQTYSDKSHTAKVTFNLDGVNSENLTITISDVSIVDSSSIFVKDKSNNIETEYPITTSTPVIIENYENYLIRLYMEWSYSYRRCTDYDNFYCYDDEWTTRSGSETSETYDFDYTPNTILPREILYIISFGIVISIGVASIIFLMKRKIKLDIRQ
ncbi:MAG: hypothetical protein ACTSQU_11410 [Promethearchaeota archaeon]